jgi:5'-nucleotidase
LAVFLVAGAIPAFADSDHDHDDSHDDSAELRVQAQKRVSWRGSEIAGTVHVKLLGINDFHGQMSTGLRVANRPVGGAGVLASYLKDAQAGMEKNTIIVHAGDHVGASPPASALLQDEPAIQFLNLLANRHCRHPKLERDERKENEDDNEEADDKRVDWNPSCNVVGTLGNHEFDEGLAELKRLLEGGNHATGPFLESPWRGARYPMISANVVDAATGKPVFPPYAVKRIDGVPIAFVGAVLKATPTIVTPSGVAGLKFLDEAEAINAVVSKLRKRNVRAIVAVIHQGGRQNTYTGDTALPAPPVTGDILNIVSRLDDEVDVVVSGHWHSFTNALLSNQNGKPILVTQAFSAGTAFADIDLEISRATRDVVAKSASIVTTWADEGAGLVHDAEASALTVAAETKVAPLVNQIIGVAATDIRRAENSAGESALGNLIADAQRAATGSDFAFMNPGGIRADIFAGDVTWGELFTAQPFGNSLVKMTLTGQAIHDLLNQQWAGQPFARLLKTSGLTYLWDATAPVGNRVVAVHKDGLPIDKTASYTVTVNSFLADGGDNFTVLRLGTERLGGAIDLDALVTYIKVLPSPFMATIEGRIQRLN